MEIKWRSEEQYRVDVLAFASEFDTPNVRRMVTACERGAITWGEAYDLSRAALARGIAAVAR